MKQFLVVTYNMKRLAATSNNVTTLDSLCAIWFVIQVSRPDLDLILFQISQASQGMPRIVYSSQTRVSSPMLGGDEMQVTAV